jgi:phosphoglycolate phosphatase
MMDIDVLIFDLDGTLVDSKDVILQGINYALQRSSREPKTFAQILPHLGVNSPYLMAKIFETDDEALIRKSLDDFKYYWDTNLTKESKLFDGVIDTLEHFKGKKMLVLSNGVARVINTMLDSFGLRKYFSGIFTGDEQDCVKPSACPIEEAFKEGFFADRSKAMMVGDMVIDVSAGKEAGIKTCAVTYGMGQLPDLKKSAPDLLISEIRALKKLIR